MVASDAVNRLWAKDETLWQSAGSEWRFVGENLAWLDLSERVGTYMARAGELAGGARAEGLQDVVVIGMGGPNLAAKTLLNTPAGKRYRRVFVLDSADPVAIRGVDEQRDCAATLFVVVDKSGKRIEIHALLLYFLNRLKAMRVSTRSCILSR